MIRRIVDHVRRIKATSFELAGQVHFGCDSLSRYVFRSIYGIHLVHICLIATLNSSSAMLSWCGRYVAKTIGQAKDF